MHTPEKRRGGSHVLRTGPSHASVRHSTGGSSTNSTSSGSGNLPALPPRAAMVNNNVATADDAQEVPNNGGGLPGANSGSGGGAALVDRRDKDRDTKDKDGGRPNSSTGHYGGRGADKHAREAASLLREQLRERDERIAALEAEMALMESEFHRELDKLSQNESETATFWQAKHSALNQQFLRTDTELRLLRAEVDVREAERAELRQGWEVLRRELRERDDEVRGLRGQVRGLKEFVSTSTRTGSQTSDEVFGDGMARLGNGLQNWVIMHFRKAKLDLTRVDEATLAELSELVPMYEDLVLASKVHLLQSLVSRILVDMVFDAYFVGLSTEQTRHFRQMEDLLCSFSASDEAVNHWRSSTLALLRREAPQMLHDETSRFVEAVIARVNRLLDAIAPGSPATETSNPSSSSSSSATNVTNSSPPTSGAAGHSSSSSNNSSSKPPSSSSARDSALRVLVNNSVELARLLVVQKAVLRVHMPVVLPHQRVLFEPETMEDVGGEDEDALARREIWCVVFPGVIKHGDENGGQMQFRNVIAKARVLCSPEE
ncbi:hypothetical protein JDV02_002615 [Purpureocillium takamizusanense]|uniref:Uncharacterized protein n=1 Tax=Purpureocillium takamizusanense TaxID=2060973 RepID=A0A9Q8Q915_9HYPO|nr:uncharacterized protein JDV02_002615 [Purpureocillium takamizusanense]UNI16149.1 hypothetical protein JDV02_002615 [Purpureocillium takamizusanense]